MEMLRQWNGESNSLIVAALQQFGIDAQDIRLVKYEALTPDSFIWFFSAASGSSSKQYCLYAEDYIPNLGHVSEVIHQYRPEWDEEVTYSLLKVMQKENWEDSSPVKSAATYKVPEKQKDYMEYAATSGYDFVFLARAGN
jgi:hypothetical protein